MDPSTGRFISPDPAKDGLNWYTYAANNPTTFIDPTGLAVGYEPGLVYDTEDETVNIHTDGSGSSSDSDDSDGGGDSDTDSKEKTGPGFKIDWGEHGPGYWGKIINPPDLWEKIFEATGRDPNEIFTSLDMDRVANGLKPWHYGKYVYKLDEFGKRELDVTKFNDLPASLRFAIIPEVAKDYAAAMLDELDLDESELTGKGGGGGVRDEYQKRIRNPNERAAFLQTDKEFNKVMNDWGCYFMASLMAAAYTVGKFYTKEQIKELQYELIHNYRKVGPERKSGYVKVGKYYTPGAGMKSYYGLGPAVGWDMTVYSPADVILAGFAKLGYADKYDVQVKGINPYGPPKFFIERGYNRLGGYYEPGDDGFHPEYIGQHFRLLDAAKGPLYDGLGSSRRNKHIYYPVYIMPRREEEQ